MPVVAVAAIRLDEVVEDGQGALQASRLHGRRLPPRSIGSPDAELLDDEDDEER
ncbi:hypothetical protein [Nitriliruptor alkaliphilus]|uniref:hypothetical protein n=1 Tax=Nitriliruptor alkaliphilus TaxID=427918 RepID=UPI0012EE08C1|nr:hypothetical protein [Nitriliruptor alkaliphilus]